MSDLQTATVFHVDLIQVVYWKCNTDFIGFGMGHLAEKKSPNTWRSCGFLPEAVWIISETWTDLISAVNYNVNVFVSVYSPFYIIKYKAVLPLLKKEINYKYHIHTLHIFIGNIFITF